MKLRALNIKKLLTWLLSAVLVFLSIGFSEKDRGSKICNDVIITITNQYDNYFINEEDLMSIISHDGNIDLVGNYIENLNLRTIESTLEDEKYIKDAQIYKDLKGNIIVVAEQRRPVARIVRRDAPDAYLDEDGEILPVSEKFTSRVMLITGGYADRLIEVGITEKTNKYLELILRINADPFWKAQVAQLDIDKEGEIYVYPQVSKQVIEFGKPEELDIKFMKLEIFFKEILPFKGWNTYSRVNLKYRNQIVCE